MKVLLLHAFPFDERMWEGYEGVAPRLYGRGESIDRWAQAPAVAKSLYIAAARPAWFITFPK